MKRREFIALLGGTVTLSLLARAQQRAKVPMIGMLVPVYHPVAAPELKAFYQGLREAGYIEGQNLAIEYRFADGKDDRLPDLAKELVGLNVSVIVTWGTPATFAAKNATQTIPIVMATAGDPVGTGLVSSLPRPGANITGQSSIAPDMGEKTLGLLREVTAELVNLQVAVIVAVSFPSALPAKAATTTIPVVFVVIPDPVDLGLVDSLNRPTGNLTGVTNVHGGLGKKRLELLHELAPKASVIGYLFNAKNPNSGYLSEVQAAAHVIGQQILLLEVSSESDIDLAFATLVQGRAGALLIGDDPLLDGRRDQLVKLAARHAIPTMYYYGYFVSGGGLISYGVTDDQRRQGGIYAGRILKGAKPSDLPVLQPTKFELIGRRESSHFFAARLLGRSRRAPSRRRCR